MSRAVAWGRGGEGSSPRGSRDSKWALLKGFPAQGNSPAGLRTQLCKTPPATSLQPKSQPRISPYKHPRIHVFLAHAMTGVSLGVREHGFAINPLCTLLQVSCKCIFLSSSFRYISEVLACHVTMYQNWSRFQSASQQHGLR